MIKKLTTEQVKNIHELIMKDFSEKSEYSDTTGNLLDSAVNSPFQTFCGVDLNPSLLDKTEKLYYSLCNNHCFKDGNKRIAAVCLILMFAMNGKRLNITNKELEEYTKKVADNKTRPSHNEIKRYLSSKLR